MRKITIINQYSGNKGDRAVCYFLISEIAKHKEFDITLSSSDTISWKDEKIITDNNVKLVPWGWNVEGFNPKNRFHWEKRRFMRLFGLPYLINRLNKKKNGLCLGNLWINKEFKNAIETSDFVVSTGGHHLTTKFTPDCHNELLFDLVATTLINPKLIFWSQTYGPFDFNSLDNKNATLEVLNRSNEVFVRDINSNEALSKLGFDISKSKKTYETVIGLNSLVQNYILPSKRKNKIGITIYNAEARTDKEYKEYCSTMADIYDWLIENNFIVRFFPHEKKGAVINDRICIYDIKNVCKHKDKFEVEERDLSTEEHLKELGECMYFIGHKTHSIIFALTVGTPLIPISYHFKTNNFLKEYDLEQNVINDHELCLESFKKVFNSISKILDETGEKQFNTSQRFSEVIKNDLNSILEKVK